MITIYPPANSSIHTTRTFGARCNRVFTGPQMEKNGVVRTSPFFLKYQDGSESKKRPTILNLDHTSAFLLKYLFANTFMPHVHSSFRKTTLTSAVFLRAVFYGIFFVMMRCAHKSVIVWFLLFIQF